LTRTPCGRATLWCSTHVQRVSGLVASEDQQAISIRGKLRKYDRRLKGEIVALLQRSQTEKRKVLAILRREQFPRLGKRCPLAEERALLFPACERIEVQPILVVS